MTLHLRRHPYTWGWVAAVVAAQVALALGWRAIAG